jgi:hypothetical protein
LPLEFSRPLALPLPGRKLVKSFQLLLLLLLRAELGERHRHRPRHHLNALRRPKNGGHRLGRPLTADR